MIDDLLYEPKETVKVTTVSKSWFASILTFYIVSLNICQIERREWTETIFRMSLSQYYHRFNSLWIEMRMVAANHSARLPQKQQDFWIHSDGLGDHVCAEIIVSLGFNPAHVYRSVQFTNLSSSWLQREQFTCTCHDIVGTTTHQTRLSKGRW